MNASFAIVILLTSPVTGLREALRDCNSPDLIVCARSSASRYAR